MCDKINVLGIHLDYLNVDAEMERIVDFIQNDHLDTVGIVTMNMLLLAEKDARWKAYLEELDMSILGETEVLEAADITSGQIYEEVKENEFFARLFWYLINQNLKIFLLGESQEEVEGLKTYLLDTYPGIDIVGETTEVADENTSIDHLANEINSVSPDVILSGLQGYLPDQFLLENRQKINGKIWISLGEHPNIQNEAGLKVSWWSTLLKKNTFRRLAAKFKEGKNE
ncbi:MAG: WecB/TagA/CpsF family glycosyltransferase [Clostridiales bacterium]|nr:WecB/TagA/CpsF family glycosyltransferase [Clostridiales bacterium]